MYRRILMALACAVISAPAFAQVQFLTDMSRVMGHTWVVRGHTCTWTRPRFLNPPQASHQTYPSQLIGTRM